MEASQLSIRAASWMAAHCVRHFCSERGISHPAIDAFCKHLEDVIVVTFLVHWDNEGNRLEITGLGDPLPASIESVQGLNDLLCAAREVTASQMYGAWTPTKVLKFLREAAARSGLDPDHIVAIAVSLHAPDSGGWGVPVSESERSNWHVA
jgi:hypothetical protein